MTKHDHGLLNEEGLLKSNKNELSKMLALLEATQKSLPFFWFQISLKKILFIFSIRNKKNRLLATKIENGNCIIEYPKKIYCKYNLSNQKVLVANGKSLVIKTLSSYYFYPLEKTPLDTILNKEYLLKKIKSLDQREVSDDFINFNFTENENEINLFFDKKTYNLIGWQTVDIYQNVSITYLSSIKRNQKLKKEIFKLPQQN